MKAMNTIQENKFNLYRVKIITAITFIIFFIIISTNAQNIPGPFDTNSFNELNQKRTKLNTIIPEIEKQISLLNYSKDTIFIRNDIKSTETNIKFLQNKIQALAPTDTTRANLQFWLDQATDRKSSLLGELKSISSIPVTKAKLQAKLDSATIARSNIENQINNLMIPKLFQQNFMFWSSISFVILMIILLLIFFIVVYNDSDVRKIIFGSDSGIQFVTLFSIIIAIILFGLTGVLEGKELSALLGSIAGYILGKVKFTTSTSQPGSAQSGTTQSGQ